MKFKQETLERIARMPSNYWFFEYYAPQLTDMVREETYNMEVSGSIERIREKINMFHSKGDEEFLDYIINHFNNSRNSISQIDIVKIIPNIKYCKILEELSPTNFYTQENYKTIIDYTDMRMQCFLEVINKSNEAPKSFIYEMQLIKCLIRFKYYGVSQNLLDPYFSYVIKRIEYFVNQLYEYIPEFMEAQEEISSEQETEKKEDVFADIFDLEVDVKTKDNFISLNVFNSLVDIRSFIELIKMISVSPVSTWSSFCDISQIISLCMSTVEFKSDIRKDVFFTRTRLMYTYSLETLMEELQENEERIEFSQESNLYTLCMIPLAYNLVNSSEDEEKENRKDSLVLAGSNINLLVSNKLLSPHYLTKFQQEGGDDNYEKG